MDIEQGDIGLGRMLECTSELYPERTALIDGDRKWTWREYLAVSHNIARNLQKGGMKSGERIAFYMRNCAEYMLTLGASFAGGYAHVNLNYRYIPSELAYIINDSDATTLVIAEEFAQYLPDLRELCPNVHQWLVVGDAQGGCEAFASYCEGNGDHCGHVSSARDQLFLYTGGTTGMPKGVVWEHAGIISIPESTADISLRTDEEYKAFLQLATEVGSPVQLPACPLMHGTGMFTAVGALIEGGAIVTLYQQKFDAVELLDAIEKDKVSRIAIVGDAFAKPILDALQNGDRTWDLTSLQQVVSSGVMFSQPQKEGLLKFCPHTVMADAFGSSEGVGLGSSVMTSEESVATAKFTLSERSGVFLEDGTRVTPGSGEMGKIGVSGTIPLGYHKDPEKTASVFKEIDGVRYSIAGDFCTVEADGSITLLGRGSACINTAGEKVFPEEVEEVLKLNEQVDDVLVVGVANAKWGQEVVAVYQADDPLNADELQQHCRAHLSAYKIPKRFVQANASLRAPNGKADYKSAQAQADVLA